MNLKTQIQVQRLEKNMLNASKKLIKNNNLKKNHKKKNKTNLKMIKIKFKILVIIILNRVNKRKLIRKNYNKIKQIY